MSKPVKAFYKNDIRMFELKHANKTTYLQLKNTVTDLFPNLASTRNQIKLRWKDSDGDLILFSSDDELQYAMRHSRKQGFSVFIEDTSEIADQMNGLQLSQSFVPMVCVSETTPTSYPPNFHGGTVCDGDGCPMSPIVGVRFKCKTCSDFDLCASCMLDGAHSHHEFWKIQFLVSDADQITANISTTGGDLPPPYE